MGKIINPAKVKLIAGFIGNEDVIDTAISLLVKKFKKLDYKSRIIDFTYTAYYEQEMGKTLKRLFVSFKKLIKQEELAGIKNLTNKIEQRLAKDNKRRVNIDPGFIAEAKLVLATTKDYTHRLYIGRGIYAEVTLYFKNKTFMPWEWTYPDYKTKEYIEIFNNIRQLYRRQLNER